MSELPTTPIATTAPQTMGQRVFAYASRLLASRRVALLLTLATLASCIVTWLILTRRSTEIETVYLMLNLSLVLLLMMGAVIARQIVNLWAQRKQGIAGSRLHVRFVFIFSILAAVPAILMAIFSALFFYFGVQAWFNDRVSTAINESLNVAQAYLKEHQQVMRADVLAMANDLNREWIELLRNPQLFDKTMQTQSMLRNLPEAIVFRANGDVIARSRLSFSLEFERLSPKQMEKAQKGEVVLITGDDEGRIRALVRLDRFLDAYLYVGRTVDANVLSHMEKTQTAVDEYTSLEGRQSRLQVSITAMFMAVALLLLLAAIWGGLIFSQSLVKPIGALIGAAEKVREGDLSVRVPQSGDEDELAMLGSAFNRMTSQLQRQQRELIDANRMLDERRRFTEAVLAGASSGIIGLDPQGVITLANGVAEDLLMGEVREVPLVGLRLSHFIPEAATLHNDTLQTEYATPNGPRRTLLLRVTDEQGGDGAVATIDDISALASAQRKAAWSDVARRIAHEIKNPLTPIQLSAERLKRKYLPQISDDPDTFEKCTDTIIRQVHEIGHLVGEFSAYARMPLPVKKWENAVDVCRDALVLQREAHMDIEFDFTATAAEIGANIDRSQLTQVMTNLLQNAIDSIHERQAQGNAAAGRVSITCTERLGHVVVSVADNGTGLPEKVRDQLLEPYVTTKKKGSGLGLAIVKKIMEDHGGEIIIDSVNDDDGVKSGAKAVIIFAKGQVAMAAGEKA